MLDKLQERVCWSVGPSRTASLEAVAHHWNVVSPCFSGRYYCGKCLSKLAEVVPYPSFPCSRGSSTHYSDGLRDFFVFFPRCYKDNYVKSFFPSTARLLDSFPAACFHMTFSLNGF